MIFPAPGIGPLIRRHGAWLMAAGAGVGILAPDLAAAANPALLPLSCLTMFLALLRVEPAAFIAVLRRPGLGIVVIFWILLACPVLVWCLGRLVLPADDVFLRAMTLIAATPGMMSAAAYGVLLGTDVALLTLVGLPTNILAPVILPAVALLLGGGAAIDPMVTALRLAVMIGASFGGAFLITALIGRPRIRRAAPAIDTAITLMVAAVGLAVMHGVGPALVAAPGFMTLAILSTLALNLALQAIGFAVFGFAILGPVPVQARLSAALVSGNRNMILLLAAISGQGDRPLELIMAAGQLPLYLSPLIVAPLYRRARMRAGG
jgi:BASS family bile acid:Na+ symporter